MLKRALFFVIVCWAAVHCVAAQSLSSPSAAYNKAELKARIDHAVADYLQKNSTYKAAYAMDAKGNRIVIGVVAVVVVVGVTGSALYLWYKKKSKPSPTGGTVPEGAPNANVVAGDTTNTADAHRAAQEVPQPQPLPVPVAPVVVPVNNDQPVAPVGGNGAEVHPVAVQGDRRDSGSDFDAELDPEHGHVQQPHQDDRGGGDQELAVVVPPAPAVRPANIGPDGLPVIIGEPGPPIRPIDLNDANGAVVMVPLVDQAQLENDPKASFCGSISKKAALAVLAVWALREYNARRLYNEQCYVDCSKV